MKLQQAGIDFPNYSSQGSVWDCKSFLLYMGSSGRTRAGDQSFFFDKGAPSDTTFINAPSAGEFFDMFNAGIFINTSRTCSCLA